MIDYVLTAAVGISSGVGALISALPKLHAHTLIICLGILILLTLINLRGVREAGGVFMYPTYVFIACLLGMIAIGVFKVLTSGGHPQPGHRAARGPGRRSRLQRVASPQSLRQRLYRDDGR